MQKLFGRGGLKFRYELVIGLKILILRVEFSLQYMLNHLKIYIYIQYT